MTRRSAWVLALWLGTACGRDVTVIGSEDLSVSDAASADAAIDASTDAATDAGPLYIEAEDGLLSGLVVEDAPAASGGRAVLAPDVLSDQMPGSARAVYGFELAKSGDYIVWGRVYAPDVDANRFWVQVDGNDWKLWRISTGEVWFWDDVHDDREYGAPRVFTLAAGGHVLVIANAGPHARLDRLYITALGDEPAGNDTACDPPHTVELGGECVPSCGLLMGTRCGPVECMDRPPLPAYDCDICCTVE